MSINAQLQRVSKHGRNYWRIRWVKPDGNYGFKQIGLRKPEHEKGITRAEARRVMEDFICGIAVSPKRVWGNRAVTLDQWLDCWEPLRRGVCAARVRAERNAITRLADRVGGWTRMDAVLRPDALAHVVALRESGLAENTIRDDVATLRMFWRLAIEDRGSGVFENPWSSVPAARIPRQHSPGVNITHEQVRAILAAAPDDGWLLWVALCAYAGLRRHEARNLRWEHVDLERNRLIVTPEVATKTARHGRTREPRIEDELHALLEPRQGEPGARLTDGAAHAASPHRVWNGTARSLGLFERAGVEAWPGGFQPLRQWRRHAWSGQYPLSIVNRWMGHGQLVGERHYESVPDSAYARNQGKTRTDQTPESGVLASIVGPGMVVEGPYRGAMGVAR